MIPDLIPRTDWEEPGWTVDEHTTSGPHPFDRSEYVVVHYTAAATTPEGEATVRDWIRRTQRWYVNERRYSLGYNWVADRQGRVWEVRGDGFKCAANGSQTPGANNHPAVLCLVNAQDPANEPMIAAVRDVVAHCEQMAGHELVIKGHRDVRSTPCPGDGLYAQVLDGTFRPQPPLEDRPMRYMLKPYLGAPAGSPWFLRWDGTWSYLTGRDRDLLLADGVEVFDDIRERYELVHRQVFGIDSFEV